MTGVSVECREYGIVFLSILRPCSSDLITVAARPMAAAPRVDPERLGDNHHQSLTINDS